MCKYKAKNSVIKQLKISYIVNWNECYISIRLDSIRDGRYISKKSDQKAGFELQPQIE